MSARGIIALLLVRGFLIAAPDAFAQSGITFVVNSTGDAPDLNAGVPGFDDRVCDTGATVPSGRPECTLRAAIQNHNANRQLDQNRIEFAMDQGSQSIRVASALPPLLGSVVLDGATQPGFTGAPVVAIDGSEAGDGVTGLELLGGNSVIRSLAIYSFSNTGIYVGGTPPPGEGMHQIQGCYIGLDSDGSEGLGNGGDGIFIDDTGGNTIGGDADSLRNVISGNAGFGIRIVGQDPGETGASTSGAPNNMISGNRIGLSPEGDIPIPNTEGGIQLNDVRDSTIGGDGQDDPAECAKSCNEIDGGETGVWIEGSLSKGISVKGNFVGSKNTAAKFDIGVLARGGNQLSVEGNAFTSTAGIGLEVLVDASGNYVFKDNRFEGDMELGTKFTFGQDRTVELRYERNTHFENGRPLLAEESATGSVNWKIFDNVSKDTKQGARLTFKADGEKDFLSNEWEASGGLGLEFLTEIEEGVAATIRLEGETFAGNTRSGLGAEVRGSGEVAFTLLEIQSERNGEDGLRLEAFLSTGADVSLESELLDVRLNGEAGLRLVNETPAVPFALLSVERSVITGQQEDGLILAGFDVLKSVTENTISDNGGSGIRITARGRVRADRNQVARNEVGVLVENSSLAVLAENEIFENEVGLMVLDASSATAESNTFHSNSALAVDLGGDGVTPNDSGDVDAGANGLQNHPIIASVQISGTTVSLQGALESKPGAVYRLEFFANSRCHLSGFGEGEVFLGFVDIETDSGGSAEFAVDFPTPAGISASGFSATATDSLGNTSEFGPCVGEGPPVAVEGSVPSDEFFVGAAYPNPSKSVVWIPYSAPISATIGFSLIDVRGRVVVSGSRQVLTSGPHQLRFDTSVLAAGTYLYEITSTGRRSSGCLVVTSPAVPSPF